MWDDSDIIDIDYESLLLDGVDLHNRCRYVVGKTCSLKKFL